jgi:hypothetical protein
VRLVVVMIVGVGCGRVGFDAHPLDAPRDGVTIGDALGDGVTTDAAACAYAAMCASGIGPEATCCTGSTVTCTLTPSSCAGTVTACDVTTSAGCGTGAACCIIAPATTPACYGPFPPPPC